MRVESRAAFREVWVPREGSRSEVCPDERLRGAASGRSGPDAR